MDKKIIFLVVTLLLLVVMLSTMAGIISSDAIMETVHQMQDWLYSNTLFVLGGPHVPGR
jgi:hypothetical protein